MATFRDALRLVMDERGIRQIDIANATGLSKSYINIVLSGYIKSVPFDRARRMIDALGMTIEEFRAVMGENDTVGNDRIVLDQPESMQFDNATDGSRDSDLGRIQCADIAGGGIVEQIERLKALMDGGVLTRKEFTAAKRILLGN